MVENETLYLLLQERLVVLYYDDGEISYLGVIVSLFEPTHMHYMTIVLSGIVQVLFFHRLEQDNS